MIHVVGIDLGNESSCLTVGAFSFFKITNPVRRFSESWPQRIYKYDYIAINFERYVSQIKHLLGWKFSDPELQRELDYIPFRVVEGPDGYPLIHSRYKGEDRTFTPVEILAMSISLLLSETREKYFPGLKGVQFCISIPMYFTDSQKADVLEAAKIAGLSVVMLLDETLAMVRAYEQYWSFVSNMGRYIVAFVDIGQASIQVCFASFKNGIWARNANVLYRGYVRSLGGRDFDRVLLKHFASNILEKYNINIYKSGEACIRLTEACEGMKKDLSIYNEASFCIKNFCGLKEFKGSVKRKDFENLCSPILEKIEVALQKALRNSGLRTEEVDYLEAVGNGASIAGITDILTKIFGREPRKMTCSCEYVARGCAAEARKGTVGNLMFPLLDIQDAGVQSVELVSSASTKDTKKEAADWKRAMDAGVPLFISLNDFLEERDYARTWYKAEDEKEQSEPDKANKEKPALQLELAKAQNLIEELMSERDNAIKEIEELRRLADQQISSIPSLSYFTEYNYSELQDATNNFHESFKLGEGGFGIVYKGILHNTVVAIKILKEGTDQGAKEFNQEVESLSKARHPNLVTFIGACAERRALVYEYLPNGSLEDRLCCKNDTPPLPWQARVRIAFEICTALSFLHCSKPHGIVHGDLKPDNILLDSNNISKLGDFGLCRQLDWTTSASMPCHWTDHPKGTPAYMDPEYLSRGKITPQYDVYSFGIMLLRLVTCNDPRGIRYLVEEAQKKGPLKALIDASAGPWPFKEAKKMIALGLRCCDPIGKNRPDLSTKVWKEMKSMAEVASASAAL